MATIDVPQIHKDRMAEVALWSSILLILFMLAIALSPYLPAWLSPNGKLTAFIRSRMFLLMGAYIAIQFLETALRKSEAFAMFAEDTLLALGMFILGVAVFLALWWLPGYRLNPDQIEIIVQCTIWSAIDVVVGVLTTERIAFAGKERANNIP